MIPALPSQRAQNGSVAVKVEPSAAGVLRKTRADGKNPTLTARIVLKNREVNLPIVPGIVTT